MNTYKIADFFDNSKKCPDQIENCEKLRASYFTSLNALSSSKNCKNCDIYELKNFYLNKIKYNSSPIAFNNNIFQVNKVLLNDKIIKKYIFFYPQKIILQCFKNYLKIISFKNNKQKVSVIKKYFFFKSFFNKFLFIFFDKKDYLLYFWFCSNVKNKSANIYSFNLKFINKYF